MYAGLSILFFFLTLFLQQIGGYTPLQSGLATLPTTIVLFVLSRRFGALADRYGPRFFMGAGPLVAAAGLVLMMRVGVHVDYLTELLPALLVFALGLAMTVAPLTAAVLAGVDESQAGIASGVNNAVARVAGLLGTAAVGAIIAAQFGASLNAKLQAVPLDPAGQRVVAAAKRLPLGRPQVRGLPPAQARAVTRAADDASLSSFRFGMGIAAALVAIGGTVAGVGIQNPRRRVPAESCPGGQLVGASPDAAGCRSRDGASAPVPAQPVTSTT
jgi:MFS family permease